MEIKKKNKVFELFKNYGLYFVVGVIIFAVALTFTLVATLNNGVEQTGVKNISFALPMQNATVVKDYSDTELQMNETLNQWEAHMAVDLVSENTEVYSILDGTVAKVEYNFLTGYSITINHDDGFCSIYSSLGENTLVKVGDKVGAGQKIGEISQTSSGELELGEHLHLTMLQNDKYLDPNNYLDLQQK